MKNFALKYIFAALAAIAALASALTAVSCEKAPTERPNTVSLSSTGETLAYRAQTTDFTILAKVDWSLESDSEWLSTTPSSGTAGTTVKVIVSVSENLSERERTGRIVITPADGGKTYSFTVTQKPENALDGINEWIYGELGRWYYWNEAVKDAVPPGGELSYDVFLKTLLSGLDDARDLSENPPTIDGGYNSDGSRYIYSYIDRFAAGTRVGAGEETTFGFDADPFIVDGSTRRLGLMVKWVQPDGPAERAGLRRGMMMVQYDGGDIYQSSYEAFWYKLHFFQGGTTMGLVDRDGKLFTIEARSMKLSPMIHDEIVATPRGKKVAYLAYNAFETGITVDGGGGEFDYDLREVFGEFVYNGATELVLDLRYNPGGFVSSCRILTSLAGNVDESDIFVKMLYNDEIARDQGTDNPRVTKFLNEGNSMKLDRVYVLATKESASASEMFINSLRGVGIEVVHIGTVTEGKNVGMDLRTVTMGGYRYEMWPITFKILNARDFCNYKGGFTPDIYKDEWWDITRPGASGVIHELGDPTERLLATALTLIDGGSVTSDTPNTRTGGTERYVSALRDGRRGGARHIPETKQDPE